MNFMKEEFEDMAIGIRISKKKKKKNRQHNGQKIKYKRTNNDPKFDLLQAFSSLRQFGLL